MPEPDLNLLIALDALITEGSIVGAARLAGQVASRHSRCNRDRDPAIRSERLGLVGLSGCLRRKRLLTCRCVLSANRRPPTRACRAEATTPLVGRKTAQWRAAGLPSLDSSPSIIIPPRSPSPTRRATTTARFAAQSAVFVPANLRYSNRPSRRIARWLIRSTPILCAVFVAFYLVRASWPFGHEKPVIVSASSQQTAGRHQNTRLPARHHSTPSAGSKDTHIRSVNDGANPMNGGSVNSSNRPSQPAASITCPARVDRLGCNGRIGVFSAPECPPGFVISGNTCVHAPGG